MGTLARARFVIVGASGPRNRQTRFGGKAESGARIITPRYGVTMPDAVTVLGLKAWSAWVPVEGIGQNRQVPATPGLYRIRRVGFRGLDYVGQTGNSLRERLGMLAGIFRVAMPYRDPHTAGPALWALRDSEGCEFEASTAVFDRPAAERKGLEALVITLYRVEHGGSPTVNFGRMPPGYRASSGNNARLVRQGKRFRGGPDADAPVLAQTVPVHGSLRDNVMARGWMGWEWSPWVPASQRTGAPAEGLYRLREKGAKDRLLYVGQGSIADRIGVHLAKAGIVGHRQGHHFSRIVEASWVGLQVATVHRLEHENDLIASHVIAVGVPPAAQFLG